MWMFGAGWVCVVQGEGVCDIAWWFEQNLAAPAPLNAIVERQAHSACVAVSTLGGMCNSQMGCVCVCVRVCVSVCVCACV